MRRPARNYKRYDIVFVEPHATKERTWMEVRTVKLGSLNNLLEVVGDDERDCSVEDVSGPSPSLVVRRKDGVWYGRTGEVLKEIANRKVNE